jgi:uncharacterized repeat protein (TIGR01451 family)
MARAGIGLLAIGLAIVVSAAEVRADSTAELLPTATSGGFTDATHAFACDDVVAVPTANNQAQVYSGFGVALPVDAIVTGIQVRVRANDGTKNNRKIQVSLSWDGGSTYTTPLSTRNFRRNTPLSNYLVGGSAVLWGRTWTVDEFSNANFRVRAVARMPGGVGSDVIHLDCIPVTVYYRIPGAPNLTIEKIDSPDPVQPEQQITYTLAYGNTGESTATNTTITDVLPLYTTFVSASPAPTSAPAVGATGTVTWNVGAVALGDSGLLTLVVKVDSNLPNGTLIENDSYSIESDQNQPSYGNVVTTTVQGTITLGLSKVGSPNPVAPGGTLTYVLTLSNGGNAPATNIVVNDAYDGNVEFDSYSTTCAGLTGDVDQWVLPSLSAGASCTITIATIVSSPLADGVLILNTADTIDDNDNTSEATAINSVRNPAVCGDGVITMPEEECDEAGANGSSASCCTSSCAIRPAGQTCRPGAGVCDVAETCDGESSLCPVDGFVGAGTTCSDDGNVCTDDECDGAGTCLHINNTAPCSDGNTCTVLDVCSDGECTGTSVECGDGTLQIDCAEECDDGNLIDDDGCSNTCRLEPCGPVPTEGCSRPAVGQSATIVLVNKSPDEKDKLVFKWLRGAATSKEAFGNPTGTTDYQFCVYRGGAPQLAMSANVPAGGTCEGRPCWTERSWGFKYKNKGGLPRGVTAIGLRSGVAEIARVFVKGRGVPLPMPDLPTLSSPVVVQVKNLESGACWEAVYSFPPAIKAGAAVFKDRAD